jgi:hypothetical protein
MPDILINIFGWSCVIGFFAICFPEFWYPTFLRLKYKWWDSKKNKKDEDENEP